MREQKQQKSIFHNIKFSMPLCCFIMK